MTDHRPDDHGRYKINWQTAVTVLIGWLVSAVLAYGAIDSRVKVLEDRYERMVEDVREIKQDIKVILHRSTP